MQFNLFVADLNGLDGLSVYQNPKNTIYNRCITIDSLESFENAIEHDNCSQQRNSENMEDILSFPEKEILRKNNLQVISVSSFRKENAAFKMSDNVVLDFDNGLTVEQLERGISEIFKKNDIQYAISFSKSNLKEKNGITCERFHIYFPITKTYSEEAFQRTKIFIYEKLNDGLMEMYGLSENAIDNALRTDTNRFINGLKNNPYPSIWHDGKTVISSLIPEDELKKVSVSHRSSNIESVSLDGVEIPDIDFFMQSEPCKDSKMMILSGERHNTALSRISTIFRQENGINETSLSRIKTEVINALVSHNGQEDALEYRKAFIDSYKYFLSDKKNGRYKANKKALTNNINPCEMVELLMPKNFMDEKFIIAGEIDLSRSMETWLNLPVTPYHLIHATKKVDSSTSGQNEKGEGHFYLWKENHYEIINDSKVKMIVSEYLDFLKDLSFKASSEIAEALIDKGFTIEALDNYFIALKNPTAIKALRDEALLTLSDDEEKPKRKVGRPRKQAIEIKPMEEIKGETDKEFLCRFFEIPEVTEEIENLYRLYKDSVRLNDIQRKCRSSAKLGSISSLLGSIIDINESLFDANPYSLNTLGGLVEDVRLGLSTIRQATPKDLVTQIAPFNPLKATEGNKQDFINNVLLPYFGNDKDRAIYYMNCLSSFIIGEIQGRMIPVFVDGGEGKTGKSTFLKLITEVLGDYGLFGFDADNFLATEMKKAKGSTASMFDRSCLVKKRLVISTDVSQNGLFNDTALRQITETTLLVRPFGSTTYRVKASHNLIIMANQVPHLDVNDGATQSRIHVMPFNFWHAPEGADTKTSPVEAFKKKYGDSILYILLETCAFCYGNEPVENMKNFNLLENIPQEVKDANTIYRSRNNSLTRFINSRIEKAEGCNLKFKDVYSVYKEHCKQNDETIKSESTFETSMINLGYKILFPLWQTQKKPHAFKDCRLLSYEEILQREETENSYL